jgi:hypothetical protein
VQIRTESTRSPTQIIAIARRVEEKDERRRGEKIRRDGEKVKEKEGRKSDIICQRVCEERKRKTLY